MLIFKASLTVVVLVRGLGAYISLLCDIKLD